MSHSPRLAATLVGAIAVLLWATLALFTTVAAGTYHRCREAQFG